MASVPTATEFLRGDLLGLRTRLSSIRQGLEEHNETNTRRVKCATEHASIGRLQDSKGAPLVGMHVLP